MNAYVDIWTDQNIIKQNIIKLLAFLPKILKYLTEGEARGFSRILSAMIGSLSNQHPIQMNTTSSLGHDY